MLKHYVMFLAAILVLILTLESSTYVQETLRESLGIKGLSSIAVVTETYVEIIKGPTSEFIITDKLDLSYAYPYREALGLTIYGPVPRYIKFISYDLYKGCYWGLAHSKQLKFIVRYSYEKVSGGCFLIDIRVNNTWLRRIKACYEGADADYALVSLGPNSTSVSYGDLILMPLPATLSLPFITISPSLRDLIEFLTYSIPLSNEPIEALVVVDAKFRYLGMKPYKRPLSFSWVLIKLAKGRGDVRRVEAVKNLPIELVANLSGTVSTEIYKDLRKLASKLLLSINGSRTLDNVVNAFSNYVSSNARYGMFNYKLINSTCPNVVSEFLFNAKRGVCIHFASALTALLRSIGIDSRVVIGLSLSHADSDYANGDTLIYGIHSWSEVYVLGSYIHYDPTPPSPTYSIQPYPGIPPSPIVKIKVYTNPMFEVKQSLKYLTYNALIALIVTSLIIMSSKGSAITVYLSKLIKLRKSNVKSELIGILKSVFKNYGITYKETLTLREAYLSVRDYLPKELSSKLWELIRAYEDYAYGGLVTKDYVRSKLKEFMRVFKNYVDL